MEITTKQNAQTTANEKVSYQPPHIDISNVEFPAICSAAISDTKTFNHMINTVFKDIFPQYRMSKIALVPPQQVAFNQSPLYTTIMFDENPTAVYDNENSFKAIVPNVSVDKNANDTMDKIKVLNAANKQARNQMSMYSMTKEASDILKDFVPVSFLNKDGSVNWKLASTEVDVVVNGQSTHAVAVSIDLRRFVEKVYGNKSTDGEQYEYLINVGAPIASQSTIGQPVPSYSYSIFILRGHKKNIQELCDSYGIGDRNMAVR